MGYEVILLQSIRFNVEVGRKINVFLSGILYTNYADTAAFSTGIIERDSFGQI